MSSLFNNAQVPGINSFQNNPNAYQGFDTSALSNSEIAQGNQAGANQIAQAKAQAAGMGAGRSSAVGNAVGNVEAGLGQNAQNIYNQNANTSFNQQLAQENQNNQFNLGEQGLQNQNYLGQAQNQQQALSSLLGAVAGGSTGGGSSLLSALL